MGEKKLISGFSDTEFMDQIKDDPLAVEEYKQGLNKLFTKRLYSKDQVIELATGKTRTEVYRDYSLPQLMRLNWVLDFLDDNPCGNMYINRLADQKRERHK